MTSPPAPDALSGRTLAVSVSQSPDLDRLAPSEEQLRLSLARTARRVLEAGGHLAYGGHLGPDGYTSVLTAEAARHGRGDQPLLVCLAWPQHRGLPLSDLRARLDLGTAGRVVCLDPAGRETDPAAGRGEAAESVAPEVARTSLTAMRRYLRARTDGRLLVGGRRADFQGELPGLLEEALLSLAPGDDGTDADHGGHGDPQPLYLAAGFGGVTVDIVRALGIDDCAWLPGDPDAAPADPRLLAGLERLRAHAKAPRPSNGLSPEENRRLAASHSPDEIAELVVLGLGRLAD
ncbi:hypothetical protein ACLVWQ_23635 [Streptomyces sp. CWNU-52B]|uniref:hypothetical protein n=1 Tax=unclassified Streptomyces TaxID=2593676 RepID=UPI0039C34388